MNDGNLPHPDSVRVEEFVNYFDMEYKEPEDDRFAIHIEGAPSRFGGDRHWLMRVGVQGKSVSDAARKTRHLSSR